MSNPTSFRFSPIAVRQLAELVHMTGLPRGDVVERAIDRMYQQETSIVSTIRFSHEERDGFRIAVLTYPDGTEFTPVDWQSTQPQTAADIPDFDWVRSSDGKRAILLDGLPRVLE